MIPGNPRHAFALGVYTGQLQRLVQNPSGKHAFIGGETCFCEDGKLIEIWFGEKARYVTYKTVAGAAWFILRRKIKRGEL